MIHIIRVAAALLAAIASGSFVAAQTATFSSRLEAVRVDVLVTDNGRVVRGLRPADFEVVDNGVVQQIDLATFEELPINVILALDMSQSMVGERLEHLRAAGRAVLDGLRREDGAALLTFSHMVRLPQALTRDARIVRDALDRVQPSGSTALVDGVYAAMTLAGSDAGRDLLLVFSDGLDTASFLAPAGVLESARRTDATMYSVSVRGSGRSSFLRDLSEQTGGSVVEIASTTDLQKTFVGILDEFRQRYLLSYTPRGVSRDGWHRLQVRLKGRRGAVTARAGYMAGT
jgi:VWFA-related protein